MTNVLDTGEGRRALLAFVGTQILPHESGLRQWLLRLGVKAHEVDDIVQDVYCRLLRLERFDHIEDPRAYLFRCARNVLLEQVRRNKVVAIMTVHNLDDLGVADAAPNPESATGTRDELARALALIQGLPERCRRVFELRKVHGLSQAQTAKALHLSENIVEKETARGLGLILTRMADALVVVAPEAIPKRTSPRLHVAD